MLSLNLAVIEELLNQTGVRLSELNGGIEHASLWDASLFRYFLVLALLFWPRTLLTARPLTFLERQQLLSDLALAGMEVILAENASVSRTQVLFRGRYVAGARVDGPWPI